MGPEAIEAVFTRFRTDRVDDFICDTLLSSSRLDALGDSAEEGLTKQECQRRLAKLPLAEGDENYFDSNSHSCRAMHATFATENPTHCAHIAFAPTEDPNGKIKCQDSADVSPSDFFAQAEIVCSESVRILQKWTTVVSVPSRILHLRILPKRNVDARKNVTPK